MLNPKDCRDFATQCVEIANSSSDAKFHTILFNMAQTWNNIAVSQEEKALAMQKDRKPASRCSIVHRQRRLIGAPSVYGGDFVVSS